MEIIKGEFIKFGEQLDMFDLIDKNFKDVPEGDKALNKCINKYTNKKSKEDEEGMETFAWLNKKSQKGEENDTTTDNK